MMTIEPILELLIRRRRLQTWLTLATLLPYYAFILAAAIAPARLAWRPWGDRGVSVGWLIALALVVGTWLLTGWYVGRANREFDAFTPGLALASGQ